MSEASEIEFVVASLVEAVVSSANLHQDEVQEPEVLLIGGYLWKFPSEGSNRIVNCSNYPPAAPQLREYPRRCDQCGVCWVSDRAYEFDHLQKCSTVKIVDIPEDIKEKAAKLGVARRVWCDVDDLFSRLQWRYDREDGGESKSTFTTNFIAVADIIDVSVRNEPVNSFQIVTRDDRTVVFQWRPENELERAHDPVPFRLELNAHQWQEYLAELSKYARACPVDEQVTKLLKPVEGVDNFVFEEISRLLLADSHELENELWSSLKNMDCDSQGLPFSLCDDEGNSLLHLAIRLDLGERSATTISTLLQMGIDCNLQNHEGERPLLLVAASGDLAAAQVLLKTPSIQVDSPCALGVSAFHAAANAGDVKMMQLLYDSGAQPELQDDNGWTALHYAAACPTGLEAIHFLCELLSDELIDLQCSEGNTALHVAAGCGCLDNVRALLETAANPHICNYSGESSYHLALRNNHIQCAVAINNYQSVSVTSYNVKRSSPTKKIVVLTTTAAVAYESAEQMCDQDVVGEWIEGVTEDGYAYYYNVATGESSWYNPGENFVPGLVEYEQRELDIYDQLSENDGGHDYTLSADHTMSSILGEQLPLCLIPMVSPLTALDNPTAAAKYEAARRKARKQRKRRHSKSS